MTDLAGWITRFVGFEKQAKTILAKHESSLHRIVTVEDTYSRLNALTLRQDDLIRQSLRCVEVGVFRGAHVLSWAAVMDYLHEWLFLDGFKKILAVRPNWKGISTLEELRGNYSEFQIIDAFRDCGYCSKSMEKALKGLLGTRNECAHPSDYYPDLNTTLGYISEVIIRLEMLEKDKAKFFKSP